MNNLDKNDLTKNQALKNSESATPFLIHFRCPDCSKLYSSNPEKIYVENPEYSCTACDTDFTVSLIQALENSEVVGIKKQEVLTSETVDLPVQEAVVATVEPEEAPQTHTEVVVQEDLAANSQAVVEGLVEEFKEKPRSRVQFEELEMARHANAFELMWQDVLGDYSNREAHSAFIRKCKDEGQLDFAFQMYGSILRNNPSDRVAKSFVAKMQVSTDVEAFNESNKSHTMLTKSFYVTLAIVGTGLALIMMGLVFGENKNLAGLGIALIFFTFAVKAFFQPRRPSVD